MFNFLLGNLSELCDRTLEVYRLCDNFSVKVHWISRDFRDHVLLREVKSLLILQVDVNIWVFASIDLTIFSSIGCCSTADFQLHLILLFELIARLLRLRQSIRLLLRWQGSDGRRHL